MNIKNNKLITIGFSILIILALIYLVVTNFYENKNLESFKNTQSMSSYYQDNTDDDTAMNVYYRKNNVLTTENNIRYTPSKWNGHWTYDDGNDKYYACFLQVNKNILFSLSKVNFDIWTNDNSGIDPYVVDEENNQCLPNMFIGRGELNQSETLFYLKEIYCTNGNTDPMSPFKFISQSLDTNSINIFYGRLVSDGNIELLYKNDIDTIDVTTPLVKDSSLDFGPSAEYLLRTSYNMPISQVKNTITGNTDVCQNSSFNNVGRGSLTKCYIPNGGIPTPSSGPNSYNSYGTGCSITNDISQQEDSEGIEWSECPTEESKTCYIPLNTYDETTLNSLNNYTKCTTSFSVNVKNQSSLSYPLYKTTGSQLDLCSIFEPFYGGNTFNSAIVMYIDNLTNVQTLGYDFFGPGKDQSYLTTKLDMMFPFMNRNILNTYRENLEKNEDVEKALNLTNCIESNNSVNTFSELLLSCQTKYATVQSKYTALMAKINSKAQSVKEDTKNSFLQKMYSNLGNIQEILRSHTKMRELIMPNVWKLNFEGPKDYTNACSFSLSTSDFYKKESQFVKYAEFDSVINRTSMNLYKGSNKQKIILENPYVIDSYNMRYSGEDPLSEDNISNNYILMSGNLRTYHPKKYLVPGQGLSTNSFGKEVYLQNNVNPDGKWLILGMNLTNNLNNGTSSNLNNKTLLKTLNAIKNAINPDE